MYGKVLEFKIYYNSKFMGCPNCGQPCHYVYEMWFWRRKGARYNLRKKYKQFKLKKLFKQSRYFKKNKYAYR